MSELLDGPREAVAAVDLTIGFTSKDQRGRQVSVDGVTFVLPRGGALGIVGETGSGKSSLARAIAASAEAPDEHTPRIIGGDLRVLGTDVTRASLKRRSDLAARVGFLRQEGGQFLAPSLTVEENIIEPIYRIDRTFDRADAGAAAAILLDAVRLPLSALERTPNELSKGQRQRVAIARSLILEPALLVADDPTAGLDESVRIDLIEGIAQLQQERGFAMLVVTADLAAVARLTPTIMVMHRGQVVGFGAIEEVLSNPIHPYVKRLSETMIGAGRGRRGVREVGAWTPGMDPNQMQLR